MSSSLQVPRRASPRAAATVRTGRRRRRECRRLVRSAGSAFGKRSPSEARSATPELRANRRPRRRVRPRRGALIVPIDGDLQNDPGDIHLLLAKIDEGYDVVSGWRRDRQDGLIRRTPSRVANWLIGRVTGVRLHDYGCTLKAYRAEIVRETSLYGEMHRFLPALAYQAGARIAEVEVRHHPRRRGTVNTEWAGSDVQGPPRPPHREVLVGVVDEAELRLRRQRRISLLRRKPVCRLDGVPTTLQRHLRVSPTLAPRGRVPVHDRLQPDHARAPRRAGGTHSS